MPLEFHGIHAEILADKTENLCFEGSRMSGKTWLLCAKIIQSCLDHPGILWLLCRYANEETKTKIRPEFQRILQLQDVQGVEWDAKESAFIFPERRGKQSKVSCYGLKAQSIVEHLAKIRGLGVSGVAVDQAEELDRSIAEELVFAKRQPGYPHQLIYTPNPVTEDHFMADMFPEDNSIPNRKHYRLSLYDNARNLTESTIRDLEQMYPPTHPKHKSLILGKRGVNIVGVSVYDRMFSRERNFGVFEYDEARPILEAFQHGQHHPAWVCAQRTYRGGLRILGAILGKRMFLEDFIPLVMKYRKEWFDKAVFKTCCDPPPDLGSTRYTNLHALRDAGLMPVYKPNSNAPDVREAIIQDLAALMRRDAREGFTISNDQTRFLMASQAIVKHSKFVEEGFEAAYVWDEHMISVGSKKVRQPKADEWIDGAQRCIENLWLNFGVNAKSDFEKDREKEKAAEVQVWKPRSVWT